MTHHLARLAFVAACLMPALGAHAADAPSLADVPPPPPNTVPEPGSVALVALALGGSLLAAQRRRAVTRRQR